MIRRSLQKHHVQLTPILSKDAKIIKLTAAHLSLGLSTYFLNWLTLLRVCSASSLDGSMMRALGALELDLTWLTLALPEDKYTWQTECQETLYKPCRQRKIYVVWSSPVWLDLTTWPSEAWFRATYPSLGWFLKGSSPKLNFSSAFWVWLT